MFCHLPIIHHHNSLFIVVLSNGQVLCSQTIIQCKSITGKSTSKHLLKADMKQQVIQGLLRVVAIQKCYSVTMTDVGLPW